MLSQGQIAAIFFCMAGEALQRCWWFVQVAASDAFESKAYTPKAAGAKRVFRQHGSADGPQEGLMAAPGSAIRERPPPSPGS